MNTQVLSALCSISHVQNKAKGKVYDARSEVNNKAGELREHQTVQHP